MKQYTEEMLVKLNDDMDFLLKSQKEIARKISSISSEISEITRYLEKNKSISKIANERLKCTSRENFKKEFKEMFTDRNSRVNFREVYNFALDLDFLLDDEGYYDVVIVALGDTTINDMFINKGQPNMARVRNLCENFYRKLQKKEVLEYISNTYLDGKKIKITYGMKGE